MGNISLTDDTSKEKAYKLFHLPIDDLTLKIKSESNSKVLEELNLLAFQRNRIDIQKLIESKQSNL